MRYGPAEYALKFRERSSTFGAEPNLALLAQAAASALALRGWQDPDTQTTVAKWQSAHGSLKVDGKYDPESAKALAMDLGKPSPPAFTRPGQVAPARFSADPSSTSITPKSPTTNTATALAQKAQALLLTKGWKDPATRAALHDWQVAHGGLATDGTYDAESAAALSVDLGGPSLSPYYVPTPSAAHPSLLAVVEEKTQAEAQHIADRLAAITHTKPVHISKNAANALTVGAVALGAAAATAMIASVATKGGPIRKP